jgi:hypothetical protein
MSPHVSSCLVMPATGTFFGHTMVDINRLCHRCHQQERVPPVSSTEGATGVINRCFRTGDALLQSVALLSFVGHERVRYVRQRRIGPVAARRRKGLSAGGENESGMLRAAQQLPPGPLAKDEWDRREVLVPVYKAGRAHMLARRKASKRFDRWQTTERLLIPDEPFSLIWGKGDKFYCLGG